MYFSFVNECLWKKKQDTSKAHESISPNEAILYGLHSSPLPILVHKENEILNKFYLNATTKRPILERFFMHFNRRQM